METIPCAPVQTFVRTPSELICAEMARCGSHLATWLLASALVAACATTAPKAQPSPDAEVQKLCASLQIGRPLTSVTLASGEQFSLPRSGDLAILPQPTGVGCVCSLLLKEGILVEKRLADCGARR